MSRRPLVLLALTLASFVATACADITGPSRETPPDQTTTCNTWAGSTGVTCTG